MSIYRINQPNSNDNHILTNLKYLLLNQHIISNHYFSGQQVSDVFGN
jgi:hypothetical protein